MDYLKRYNIKDTEYRFICDNLNPETLINLEVMQYNVEEVLKFLIEKGVKRPSNIVNYRPDLCLKPIKYLEEKLSKLDVKLIVYIIDNSIDDLICFDI